MSEAEFDQFATSYNKDLSKSLAITGEGRDFYAQGRIDWTAKCTSRLGLDVRRILDYGCGDGSNAPMLAARFKPDRILGVDISKSSVALASQAHISEKVSFLTTSEWVPDANNDLAYVNGVFHHIKPEERIDILSTIRRALNEKGLLAFWENNPWNPGTRYVMSQCAFDENAITISPWGARRMLSQAGFRILRCDFLFIFPRQLGVLRPAERLLRGLPLGGQFQVLCQA